MGIMDKLYMEYESAVAQLSATSEVAGIGHKFKCPIGEVIEILSWRLNMATQGAGEGTQVSLWQKGSVRARTISSASLSGDGYQSILGVLDRSASGLPSNVGDPTKFILTGGQFLTFKSTATIDADTTQTIAVYYTTTKTKAVVTAEGAGISISSEVHVSL